MLLNKKNKIIFLVVCFFIFEIFFISNKAISEGYDSFDKRDPFVPLIGGPKKKVEKSGFDINSINLQGISFGSDGKFFAIINGEIVKEGETVGSVYMKTIKQNSVVVKLKEKEYEIVF